MDDLNSGSIISEQFSCEKILVKRKCKYCDFMTDLRISLANHFWRYHKTSRNNSNTDLKIKVYPCNSCDFTTYSILVSFSHRNKCSYVSKDENKCSKSLYISTQSCSPKQIIEENEFDDKKLTSQTHVGSEMFFSCKLCEYKSMDCHDFYRHYINCHTVPNEIKRFQCDQCGHKAKSTNLLKQHINLKHACENLVYHKCGFCNYKTPFKEHLKKHIVTQHTDPEEIKWFKCDRCEYKGKVKCYLLRHIKLTHASEDQIRFKCNQCSFSTIHRSALKDHMHLRHTDPEEIKWFECDQCGFKAKRKGNLNQHYLRHIRAAQVQ